MSISGIIVFLLVGAIAGWLAGNIIKGGGFGLVGNIAVGIIGSFVGGVAFNLLGLSAWGFLGSIIMSTIGAVILLLIVGLIKRA
jgi:uncharacterized membrane protein YeaQ/YmgE (transglycosylase-associated protein family)